MAAAQLASGGCHARVVFELKDRAVHFVVTVEAELKLLGLGAHGAELVQCKAPSVPADASLAKQYRCSRFAPQNRPVQEIRDAAENHADATASQIDEAFDEQLVRLLRYRRQRQQKCAVANMLDVPYPGRRRRRLNQHPQHNPTRRTAATESIDCRRFERRGGHYFIDHLGLNYGGKFIYYAERQVIDEV